MNKLDESDNIITISPAILTSLKKFLKSIVIGLSSKGRFNKELRSTTHLLLGKDGVAITLIDDEVKKYLNILVQLQKIYPNSKNYGRSFSENVLKDAIWQVLRSKKKTEESWKDGIKLVKDRFKIVLTEWDVYFPVSGIDFTKQSTWNFGKVTFIKQNNRFLKNALLKSHLGLATGVRLGDIACFGRIKVKSADFDSAIKIARPVMDLHIAILNAIVDISGSIKINDTISSYIVHH